MTKQLNVYVTAEAIVNDGPEGTRVLEKYAERILKEAPGVAVIIVIEQRQTHGREVLVSSYMDFTPDYPPERILRGLLRRTARLITGQL